MKQNFNAGLAAGSQGAKPTKDVKRRSMLVGFEGTGEQTFGTTNWASNVYGRRSFVNRCVERAVEPEYAKYMAGPDAGGRELGNILSDAIDFYTLKKTQAERKGEALRVSIVGYSRGGYLALCFAKYLQLEERARVKFLGLFDAVARDFTGSVPKKYRAYKVPENVSICYHALRKENHSREWFANTGLEVENGDTAFKKKVLGGTHAALGGFPMDTPERHSMQGMVDMSSKPYIVQAAAEYVSPGLEIRPIDERNAWMEAASFISEPALNCRIITRGILE